MLIKESGLVLEVNSKRMKVQTSVQFEKFMKKLDYLWALESITSFFGAVGYLRMQKRFADRYADAAAESCYGLRCQLQQPELAKEVYRNTRQYFRKEKLNMEQQLFEKFGERKFTTTVKALIRQCICQNLKEVPTKRLNMRTTVSAFKQTLKIADQNIGLPDGSEKYRQMHKDSRNALRALIEYLEKKRS